jgi:hypothetical protein
MNESEKAVRIIHLGSRLQKRMAHSNTPDLEDIIQLCQELQNCASYIYQWAVKENAEHSQSSRVCPTSVPQ